VKWGVSCSCIIQGKLFANNPNVLTHKRGWKKRAVKLSPRFNGEKQPSGAYGASYAH